MVEFEWLETKTLKCCKDAEYPTDMPKSKNIKTKDRQRIFKRLKTPSKAVFHHKWEFMLALATKRSCKQKSDYVYRQLLLVNSLEQRLWKTTRYVRRSWILFSAADTIVLFFNTC